MSLDADDLERSLATRRPMRPGRDEGVFGPGSAVWQVDREALVFLGAGRALLMHLAHPWVATAIAEHSTTLADPIGRFHRTFEIVFTLVFGSLDQAVAASRRLHRRHAAITGVDAANGRPLCRGLAVPRQRPPALMWVHATLVDTAVAAYELVLPPLDAETRARYYAESRLLGALFGIPVEAQPPDWPAFGRYVEETVASDRLTVGAAARAIAAGVLAGAGRIPVPRWYRDVTAALLPERLRGAFGLPFSADERRRAMRALLCHPAGLSGSTPALAPCGALPRSAGADRRPQPARSRHPFPQPPLDRSRLHGRVIRSAFAKVCLSSGPVSPTSLTVRPAPPHMIVARDGQRQIRRRRLGSERWPTDGRVGPSSSAAR